MADPLWRRAESDLWVEPAGAVPDPVVWEHSSRVARLADVIVSLPEVTADVVDRVALAAAALYHDAGWVLQLQAGELTPQELLLRPTSDILHELAADWIASRLKGIIPPASLQLAARAIRACSNRRTDLIEAQILTEANNLDEIGPQTISLMLRKQWAEGKTLDDLVTAWQRQQEYHYWQARIRDSFRFPSVRALAERRWQGLRQFMANLQAAIRLEDVAEIQRLSRPKKRPRPPSNR